jgi:uncharacterized membrane protein
MRRRRAAALLFFAGVFLLSAGFTGAVSVDYGQILFARSEIRATAEDAAVAAAREYATDETLPVGALLLNEAQATARVQEAFDLAVSQESIRRAQVTSVTVTFENNATANATWFEGATQATARAPRVVVTVEYSVSGLLLMDLFDAVDGDGGSTIQTGTQVASAVICVPGLNPDTLGGACARSDS